MQSGKLEFSKGTTDYIFFDSLQETSSYYENKIMKSTWKDYRTPDFMEDRHSSFNGEAPKDVLNSLKTGWDKGAELSTEILSKLEDKLKVESSAYKNVSSVVGSTFNVGAYLAGSPYSMRMRKKVVENTNPINIILDITSSAGTSENEFLYKGVAAIALARVLIQSRPVNIQCISGMRCLSNNLLFSFPVESNPLNLSTASYVLSRPEMLRRVGFSLVAKAGEEKSKRSYDGYIQWLFTDYGWQSNKMIDEYAKVMGYGSDYVAVAGVVHSDRSDGSRDNLEAATNWVLTNANKLLALKEDN